MGDPRNTRMTLLSLPPGCRFYPSEEQLIRHYLTPKNNGDRRFGFDVLNEVDLYNYNPFDLPDTTCFRFGRGGRKRHCYCYAAAARVLTEGGGRRRAGGGYWKRMKSGRDVMGGAAGKVVVVGTRKSFVFYLGDSPKTAVRTDWVMNEYALVDHDKAAFVLCRIFVKARNRNTVSENVLSSCGEESVATVRQIGIQHDGAITPGTGEAILRNDNSVDGKNKGLSSLTGLVSKLDDQITAGAVTPAGVQLSSSMQHNELVTTSGLTNGASMFVDGLAAHYLKAILEEDFMELDDLATPL